MTLIREAEDRIRQLSTLPEEEAVRRQCYNSIFHHALFDLHALLDEPVDYDIFLDNVDPTRYEKDVAVALEKVKADINEFYLSAHTAHLAAKKPWSQALQRVYQLQVSPKATDAQVDAAALALEKARVQFQATLNTFMDARRMEEAFRHAPATYQAQSMPAIIWLAQHILRVHSYTPGSGYLTEDLLRELPTV